MSPGPFAGLGTMSVASSGTHHQPRVELRPAVPYLGITASATDEASFRAAVDRDMPALFRHAADRGLTPAGGPFLRYLVVDETSIPPHGPPPATFQSGLPLRTPAPGDALVRAGTLPAGRWLVTLHRGGYSGLPRAHAVLHEWAAAEGAVVDRRSAPRGTAFGASVEHFRIGPSEESDPWRWETEVAYLLVD